MVGVNHTYETAVTPFADGRVVPMNPAAIAGALGAQTGGHDDVFRQRAAVCEYKTADLASVADQLERLNSDPTELLAGRLDLGRFAALGHSFGGNAALEWCRTDQRCRAAVNLDGALWSEVGRVGLDRPAMQVLAEHREFAVAGEDAVKAGAAPNVDWFEAEKAITFGGWRTVQQRAQPGYTVQIGGATPRELYGCSVPPGGGYRQSSSQHSPPPRSNRSGCGVSPAICCLRSSASTSMVTRAPLWIRTCRRCTPELIRRSTLTRRQQLPPSKPHR